MWDLQSKGNPLREPTMLAATADYLAAARRTLSGFR
jgi:hypothetical protein